MSSHPWLTLSTIATAVALLGALAGAAGFVVNYFETSSEARDADRRNAARDAWTAYGVADLRRILARNRVWECDAKEQRQATEPMVAAERVACNQYRRDFDAAESRANQLFNDAMQHGRQP